MQTFAHHWMQTAIKLFLFIGICGGGPKGEMVHAASSLLMIGTCDLHHNPPDAAWKAGLIQNGSDFLLGSISSRQPARMPAVNIDHYVVV